MWRTLTIVLLIITGVWWFFFHHANISIDVAQQGQGEIENMSALEYKKYVRVAMAKSLGYMSGTFSQKEENDAPQENDTDVTIYILDDQGKLVADKEKV